MKGTFSSTLQPQICMAVNLLRNQLSWAQKDQLAGESREDLQLSVSYIAGLLYSTECVM